MIAATSSAVPTVAIVRVDCRWPPTLPSPPELSFCTALSWRDTSDGVTPSPAISVGSRSTCTSRSTPPTRATEPTPFTASSALETLLSTNQDRSCSSRRLDAIVYVSSDEPAKVCLDTVGAAMLLGNSARALSTALRTSLSAASLSLSSSKLTLMLTAPSVIVVVMWSSSVSEASLSSILRATSVSSCDGAAPSSEAVTWMVGTSMSGKSWISSRWKPIRPSTVSRMKSRTEGTGLRMAQAEKFMVRSSPGAVWPRPR